MCICEVHRNLLRRYTLKRRRHAILNVKHFLLFIPNKIIVCDITGCQQNNNQTGPRNQYAPFWIAGVPSTQLCSGKSRCTVRKDLKRKQTFMQFFSDGHLNCRRMFRVVLIEIIIRLKPVRRRRHTWIIKRLHTWFYLDFCKVLLAVCNVPVYELVSLYG